MKSAWPRIALQKCKGVMYISPIVSVLNHAWATFGPFTSENHEQVVQFVHKSMKEILNGEPAPQVVQEHLRKF